MSSAALGYVLAAVGVVALIAAIAFHFMVPNSTPPGTVEVPAVSPAVPGAPPRPIGPPPAVPDKGLAPAPPTAPAPPPTEASSGGITRKEMADFLISRGYQASVTGDGIGNTIVKTAADGTRD